ncbi:MAG: hypothetical protein JWQ87_5412 [Candidatus Sulfotelmatobacter sp.]|nr:hypothetical protein [Candidatus Sulfotelmatobacter sp.]
METQTELLIPKKPSASTVSGEEAIAHNGNGNPFLSVIERCVLDPNFSVEKLQAMLKVQQEWEALQARKAFDEAKAKFSAFAVKVTKDKTNGQYDSRYTSLGNLVNTVTPYLAQCDLNASWKIDQSAGIKVTCVLRHILGHEESASMTVPPDTSGAKNVIQQIKSSITYAKNCTFESVCGLASTDGTVNVDDDGNGAGVVSGRAGMGVDWVNERREWFANARNAAELDKLFKAAYAEASKVNDTNAQRSLIAAKDARKREF